MLESRAMKCIVTGGAGLIGSNIVKLLNARSEEDVLVVDHLRGDPLKRRNLDSLRFARYLERDEFREAVRAGEIAPPERFFHLGACSSTTETDESFLDDNNTGYTREMCEWCLANGARFVYASSAATYGDGSLGYSDDEARIPDLRPLNLYGWSKQKFDLWALSTGASKRIAGLKYFNVFGPGEDHKGEMRSVVAKQYATVRDEGRIALFRSDRPDPRSTASTTAEPAMPAPGSTSRAPSSRRSGASRASTSSTCRRSSGASTSTTRRRRWPSSARRGATCPSARSRTR